MSAIELAIIGGTGLYQLAGLQDAEAHQPVTHYGALSGPVRVGLLDGHRVAFLARHGEGHSLPPHKINYRANLAALKSLGAQRVLAMNTVGGITERFPLMVSALSSAITHVRAEEFSDIRTYGAPAVVSDIMLFGKTPQEAAASPMVQFLGQGFQQSMEMVADELGFAVDNVASAHDVAVATAPIGCMTSEPAHTATRPASGPL